MKNFLFVFLGAGFGGGSRYLITNISNTIATKFFPGTILVNLIGCFFAGLFLFFTQKHALSEETISFATIGFLGGFTTFSAFSAETILYIEKNQILLALFNVLTSLSGVMLTYIGYIVAKYLGK